MGPNDPIRVCPTATTVDAGGCRYVLGVPAFFLALFLWWGVTEEVQELAPAPTIAAVGGEFWVLVREWDPWGIIRLRVGVRLFIRLGGRGGGGRRRACFLWRLEIIWMLHSAMVSSHCWWSWAGMRRFVSRFFQRPCGRPRGWKVRYWEPIFLRVAIAVFPRWRTPIKSVS